MTQSRSDEAKLYRERKKTERGQDWLIEEARKRKERRNRNRATPAPTPVVVPEMKQEEEHKSNPIQSTTLLDEIVAAKQASAAATGHTIKKESVQAALNKVKRIHKYKTDHEMSCFDWVRDTTAVSNFIENCEKWKSKESKLQQYQALASILKVFTDYQKEYKFYSGKSIAGRKQKETIDDENKLTEKEKENYLDWSKIYKLNKSDDLTAYEASIVGCYTLIPPRRAKDFGLMKITTTDVDLDDKYNYLKLNSKGKPARLIFLNYKTDKQFGRQELRVPRSLSSRLQAHITESGLAPNDFLFGKSKSEPYKSFSSYITKVFKKYTGKAISVNVLRHSYVTNFLKSERTLAERKDIANQMAHSVLTQLKYNRI
jgi:hypothetical protein